MNFNRDEDKPIDLDLIYFGNKVIEKPPLIIPHHKAHKRKYILVAMNELNPDFIHPIFGKKQSELLDELDCDKEVNKISD